MHIEEQKTVEDELDLSFKEVFEAITLCLVEKKRQMAGTLVSYVGK